MLVRLGLPVYEGAFEGSLDIPPDAKPGKYFLKVASDAALGWSEIEIFDRTP